MLIQVTNETKPLGVPYSRSASDASSHSYIDLKRTPESLKDIPEIRDCPELATTLQKLNRPEIPFRTLGCEKCVIPQDDGMYGASGYVQVCFDDTETAKDQENYLALFRRFQVHAAQGWPDNDTVVQFEMQPTFFIELNETCWSFSFWLIVRNCKSDIAAKEKWSNALKFFREFLLQ